MSEKQSSKCIEMQEMEKPKGVQVEEGSESESESDEDNEETEKEDDVTLPKINTFVGFIRLANFLSATTVLFILVTFLASGHVWQEQTKSAILTLIQVLFLGCLSILVYIDCIGTISFCWREYGELSTLHTDATSIVFLATSNRWILRIGSGLLFLTSLSFPVLDQLVKPKIEEILPNPLYWVVGLVGSSLVFNLLGLALSLCVNKNRVPWLQGTFQPSIIHDEDDAWKIKDHYEEFDTVEPKEPKESKEKWMKIIYEIVQIFGMFLCFLSFISATIFHTLAFYSKTQNWSENPGTNESVVTEGDSATTPNEVKKTDYFNLNTILICLLVELACLALIVVRSWQKRFTSTKKSWIPRFVWMIAPYLYSCGVSQVIKANPASKTWPFLITWAYMLFVMVMFSILYLIVGIVTNIPSMKLFWINNFQANQNWSRKILRFLDTLASILVLTGMIFGFASIFNDQYDIELEADGFLKDFHDSVSKFANQIYELERKLQKEIKKITLDLTCEDKQAIIGGTFGGTLAASFIPGLSIPGKIFKTAVRSVLKTSDKLSKLVKVLGKLSTLGWKVSRTLPKLSGVLGANSKNIAIGSNLSMIFRLLPLLPPVYFGIFVLFGVFWPSRVVFFTKKQRLNHFGGRLWSWTMALFLLILAVLINSVVLQELIQLLDKSIPFVKVSIHYKFGWTLSLIASVFAVCGTFLYWCVALVQKIKYDKDHENLTAAEESWKAEIEKRQMIAVKTPFGDIFQMKSQASYGRSRISAWTWVLPILLTLIACGFGIAANMTPKIEMKAEEKGDLTLYLEKSKRDFKELRTTGNEVQNFRNETQCLPPTLDTYLEQENVNLKKVLLAPVTASEALMKEFIAPIEREFDQTYEEIKNGTKAIWEDYNLDYLGLIFNIPRFVCLLIVLFGCFISFLHTCQMKIIVEPRKIVDIYEKLAFFSIIYVIGSCMTIYSLLTSFGIPFCHMYVKFGHGFVYDVVADCILLATRTGMRNEFFFAIPKKKTTVTYDIPNVTNPGPNLPNQIIT